MRGEILSAVQRARLSEMGSDKSRRIVSSAKEIAGEGTVFYLLADTPDQGEDVIRVLVDDRVVVGFDLPRNGDSHELASVEMWPVREFERASRKGRHGEIFRAILKQAQDDMSRTQGIDGSDQSR